MNSDTTNQTKWHQSITIKLAILAFLGIVLLIPLQMIKEVIRERQASGEKAIREVSDQWAAKQCLSGPVLNIPVRLAPAEKGEKSTIRVWHMLADNLEISGTMYPEIRKRGIYKAVVFSSDLKIKGQITVPEAGWPDNSEILWRNAYYTIGISDNRGLKGKVIMKNDASDLEAEPGVRDTDIFPSGISFPLPALNPGKMMNFSMTINLSGSEGLQLTPVGKTTLASLKSVWSSPGFTGNFLPVRRVVDEKGFSAEWEVTHLNRNYPQSWTGSVFHPTESAFGVDLFQPVDHYQKSWRSARYGILFIALTFLILIFLEITTKETIHIFNYFLVSLGLVLFFSLLNSLSEQLGFNIAYLIASAATIIMISIFTGRLFTSRKRALIVSGMLGILYTFIFILLSLNEFAYLAGNIGLFILLSTVMLLSSRMKIFRSGFPGQPDQPSDNNEAALS